MIYPIKEILKNEITNHEGDKSYFFKVLPKDLEQLNPDELVSFISNIQNSLNALSDFSLDQKGAVTQIWEEVFPPKSKNNFYKFYFLGGEIFLNTNYKELSLPNIELVPHEEMMEAVFQANDFYEELYLGDDYIKLGGEYIRLLNVYEFPKGIEFFDFCELGDYVLFFNKVDKSQAKRRVNTQRKLHHANLHGQMRNIESEASHAQAEQIYEDIIHGKESLFHIEAWFILKERSLEELGHKTKRLINDCLSLELKPLVENVGLEKIFPTLIPGLRPLFKRVHPLPTSYLTNLLPLKRDFLMEEGMELYSRFGNKIFFDLYCEKSANFNALITGLSGTGKSVFAQKLVKEQLANGCSSIVLDLGNSFRKLSLYHGAEIFSESFNPMQFRNPIYLKEFVVSVIPESELTYKTQGKIFQSIEEALNKNVKTFKELIYDVEKAVPELSFYFSELWPYFDNKAHDLNKLTYVDTSIYPDKLKGPLIIFLIEYFKNLSGRRVFVFDECWSFLIKNAQYVAECFRTFRKYSASAIAISQSFDDFLQTAFGKAIAQNSYYKFIFAQTTEGGGFLDQFDLDVISGLKSERGIYSECYIKSDAFKKVARLFIDPLEYELFTTTREDNFAIEKFLAKERDIFSFQESMNRWVSFKYDFGGMNA